MGKKNSSTMPAVMTISSCSYAEGTGEECQDSKLRSVSYHWQADALTTPVNHQYPERMQGLAIH